MNAVSFEIAHIYADQTYGPEQAMTVVRYQTLAAGLRRRGIPFTTTALVDDANADASAFDPAAYAACLTAVGAAPQAIAFESRFATVTETILQAIPPSQKRTERVRKDGREIVLLDDGGRPFGLTSRSDGDPTPSCALLSAAWSLCRLGLHPFPHGSIHGDASACRAELIINILPARYQPIEEKVLRILSAVGSDGCIARIKTILVPDRQNPATSPSPTPVAASSMA